MRFTTYIAPRLRKRSVKVISIPAMDIEVSPSLPFVYVSHKLSRTFDENCTRESMQFSSTIWSNSVCNHDVRSWNQVYLEQSEGFTKLVCYLSSTST